MSESFCNLLLKENFIAIIRPSCFTSDQAKFLALQEAGLKLIEVAINHPNSPSLIEWVLENKQQEVCLGAATVCNLLEAKQAYALGLHFLASPISEPEICKFALDKNCPFIPGAHTPQEVIDILKIYPFPLIKLFPVDSPTYYRHLQTIFPQTTFVLSGFTMKDYFAYLRLEAKYFIIGHYFTENLRLIPTRLRQMQSLYKKYWGS